MTHDHDASHHHGSEQQYDDLLDLDAVVLAEYWATALDAVCTAAPDARRVVDIGAGSGNGALGLAARLPQTRVTAVDVTATSLERLSQRAAAEGTEGRITTVVADLDTDWPDLGTVELTWASMSLHHLADPAAALDRLFDVTVPGGLLAVVELGEPLRFLPPSSPVAGAEEQLVAVSAVAHNEVMPTLGTAWAPRIAQAEWTVTHELELAISPADPSTPEAYRYAHSWLSRQLEHLADRLDPAARDALGQLLADGPEAMQQRTALQIRGSRILTLARR